MKKIILFLSILIAGFYLINFISAISINKSAGDILDSTTWGKISSVTDKISVSGGDMKVNGKIYISGKLCDNSGKCLGDATGLGSSSDNPGLSCSDILDNDNSAEDGNYYIKPTGYSGSAFQVYCDMTTSGGGWTMVVAQYEQDPVTDWDEGIQSDYDPSLATKKGFALNTTELPKDSNQVAFGKDLDPTFVGYSYFQYSTGDIPKTTLYNNIDNKNYHIHRNKTSFYGYHEPARNDNGYAPNEIQRDTLTYDDEVIGTTTWAFSPNYPDGKRRGFSMQGGARTVDEINYARTVWVRKGPENALKRSCNEIKNAGESTGDGLYYIDPNGGDNSDKFQVYCDMTTDGGGWTLALNITENINQLDLYNTEIGTPSLSSNYMMGIKKLSLDSDTNIKFSCQKADSSRYTFYHKNISDFNSYFIASLAYSGTIQCAKDVGFSTNNSTTLLSCIPLDYNGGKGYGFPDPSIGQPVYSWVVESFSSPNLVRHCGGEWHGNGSPGHDGRIWIK